MDVQQLLTELRQVVEVWERQAREQGMQAQANRSSNTEVSSYMRGVAETYHRAAAELRGLLSQLDTSQLRPVSPSRPEASQPPRPASPPAAHKPQSPAASQPARSAAPPPASPMPSRPAATVQSQPPAAKPSPPTYAPVPLKEALDLLSYAGLYPRNVKQHKDNAFTATFSKMQATSNKERIEAMQRMDPRIIILDQGKLSDNGDPFIDFAFKPDVV